MSRLPVTPNVPSKPASVTLAELAIAGGTAGYPLAICFRDFPAPVLCELWRHCISCMAAHEVYHVQTPTDARKLASHAACVRVVLVHSARLHNQAAWALRMSQPGFGQIAPCPATFTNSVPSEPDEDPGATLILQANPVECRALVRWLTAFGGRRNWPDVAEELTIGADAALRPVLRRTDSASEFGTLSSRDHDVLRGLLAGACLLRSSGSNAESVVDLNVTLDDYEHVRRLLRSPAVSATGEACDPLAVAMVNRANVYLSVKYCPNPVADDPFYADDYDSYVHGTNRRRDLVTRREIADLGNVRSSTVRKLVDYLRRQPDGYEPLVQMGFRRRPPTRDEWRKLSVKDFRAGLQSWTPKQVRTHFDTLKKRNFVTAEREHANGAWRYRLPEELSQANSRFRSLPLLEQLVPRTQPEVDTVRNG